MNKFFDLKGDALEEKRERIQMGEVAHCYKLKFNRGYLVTSMPKDVYAKLFPKSATSKSKESGEKQT